MENSEAELQWLDDGDDEEVENEETELQGRKSRIQTQQTATDNTTSPVSNGDSYDNGGHVVNSSALPTNGADDVQREVEKELKISANGVKIDDLDETNIGVGDVDRKGSENSVYYDTDQGIWKCRFCPWDFQHGSGLIDHMQCVKRHWHMLMNAKTLDQQGPCFIHETEGVAFGYEPPVKEQTRVEYYAQKIPADDALDVKVDCFDIGNGFISAIDNQHEEHPKHEIVSASSIQSSEISFEELINTSIKSYSNKAIDIPDIDLIEDGDNEATEFDVETVLKKQDTHDLFCPNCNSCITRRVILRKRKRRVRTAGEDAKRNRLDVISDDVTSDQARSEVNLDDNLPPALNDYDRDLEPDVFRCLSCFSIFIPKRDGISKFWMFGDRSKKENMQDSQKIPAVKNNWFSSIFSSKKGAMLTETGTGHSSDVHKSNVGAPHNLDEPKDQSSSRQEALVHAAGHGVDMQNKNAGAVNPSSQLNDPKIRGSLTQDSRLHAPTFVIGLGNSRISDSQGVADNNVSSLTQVPLEPGKLILNTEQKLDDALGKCKGVTAVGHYEADTLDEFSSPIFSSETPHSDKSDSEISLGKPPLVIGEPVENTISSPRQDGLKFLIPSNAGSLVVEDLQKDQTVNVTVQKKSPEENTILLLSISSPAFAKAESNICGKVNNLAHFPSGNEHHAAAALQTESVIIEAENENNKSEDGAYEISQDNIVHQKVDIHLDKPPKFGKDALISSIEDALLHQDGQINLSKDSKHFSEINAVCAGKDTIITVKTEQVDTALSQSQQTTLVSSTTGALTQTSSGVGTVEQRGATARNSHRLDIVKSIIYGGLIESITSVGVVSSAVGAHAATLNVLALGLANLFGGLFIIGNNLWDLKNEHTGGPSDQVVGLVDRYEVLLGRRENFLLHSIVAVFSYLVFGLLPPVMYGFSFHKSNDKDLKLLVVAVASVICIVLLATGKVYVQRPPKSYLKTVPYYVTMGLLVSGAAYVVGNLINRYLEQLGLFSSSSVVTLALPGTRLTEPAWRLY